MSQRSTGDDEKVRTRQLLHLTASPNRVINEEIQPSVTFGAEEHLLEENAVEPSAPNNAIMPVSPGSAEYFESANSESHSSPRTNIQSADATMTAKALALAPGYDPVIRDSNTERAEAKCLTLAPGFASEPSSRIEEDDARVLQAERAATAEAPGAFRMSGGNEHENDDSAICDGDAVGNFTSDAHSTTFVNSSPLATYHVSRAQAVDSFVFQATAAHETDKKRQQRKTLIIVALGVLIVIAVVLATVLGTRTNGGLPVPTPAPTVPPEQWVPLGSEILGINSGDQSGISLAMSDDGTIIAVGAIYYDGFDLTNNATDSGLVRVYHLVGDDWVQRGSGIEGETSGDLAGTSVSLSSSGSIIAVGAYKNDGLSLDSSFDSGHVRVYVWSGSEWVQRGTDIDGDAFQEGSGFSVALSADGLVLAVGAPGYTGTAGAQAGRVRVFSWDGTAWRLRGVQIEGVGEGDLFGESISLSADGTVFASGAQRNDPTPDLPNAGEVRIFHWNNTGWNQRGGDINGEGPEDRLGSSPSVALTPDGRTLAVAATSHDGDLGDTTGQVKVYDYFGDDGWIQRGLDIQGTAGDELGTSVKITRDGNIVLIGTSSSRLNGLNSGVVKAFMWNGVEWSQLGGSVHGEALGDEAGIDAAISGDGNTIAVSAPKNDGDVSNSDVGQVRVFKKVVTP